MEVVLTHQICSDLLHMKMCIVLFNHTASLTCCEIVSWNQARCTLLPVVDLFLIQCIFCTTWWIQVKVPAFKVAPPQNTKSREANLDHKSAYIARQDLATSVHHSIYKSDKCHRNECADWRLCSWSVIQIRDRTSIACLVLLPTLLPDDVLKLLDRSEA
jgi:hypothetical protein